MKPCALASLAMLIPLLSAPEAPAGPGEPVRPATEIERLIEAAAEGDTVAPPAGVYAGPLRVTKPIVLDGRGQVTIDGGGKGTVVEILAGDVTFRGFHVRGSAGSVDQEPAGIRAENGPVVIENNRLEDVLFGIDLRTSSGSIIRDNRISGKDLDPGRRGDGIRLWWSNECIVEANEIIASRDMVFWYSEGLQVRGNRVRDSRYGLHFMYSHDTTLTGNVLESNSVGVYLMYSNRITLEGNILNRNRGPSGYGLGLKDCDDIVVRGNALSANRVGIYVDNAPSSTVGTGLIEDNVIAFNEIGILMTPNTKRNVLAGNGFVENEEQAAVHGRGELSGNAFASDERGNFWSDYAGFDRDGDGMGDLPYEARSLFESLLAREPNLRLFVHSPAQQAIEFTSRALPEMRPEPKFIDPRPLMSPPAAPVVVLDAAGGGSGGSRSVLLAAGGGLVGSAGIMLGVALRRPGLKGERGGRNKGVKGAST